MHRSSLLGVFFIAVTVISYTCGELSIVEGTMPHTTSRTCTRIDLFNLYPNIGSLPGNEAVLYNDVLQNVAIDFGTDYWNTANNKVILTYKIGVDELKIKSDYSDEITVNGDCFSSDLANTIYFDLYLRAASPLGTGNYIVNSVTIDGSINTLDTFSITGVGGDVKKYFLDPVTLTTLSSDGFTFDATISINPSCSGSTCTNPCPNCNQLSISFVSLSCEFGYSNCNDTLTDGCETNTQTDPNNCKSCGDICTTDVPNSVAVCVNSECASDCAPEWRDCNEKDSDGCEISVINDVNNCGECGFVCERPNMFATCSGYQCNFDECHKGYYDCDKDDLNGCESDLNDAKNCGKCGTQCPENTICSLAGCVCAEGFGDCDRIPSNGCEVSIINTANNCGGCGRLCGVNQNCIFQQCLCTENYFANCDSSDANGCEVDFRENDNNNCGSCGNNCGVNSYCKDSQCYCEQYFGDCLPKESGCETDLRSSPNCGNCGVVCSLPNAISECDNGICIVKSCIGIFENCDGDDANGCEASVTTASRCGSCINTCGANSVCDGGVCTCVYPFRDCNGMWADGCETNTNTDNSHCGTCADGCTAGATVCNGGSCVTDINCKFGLVSCLPTYPGCEIDILTDSNNCGGCGLSCGATGKCENGICTCSEGFDKCKSETCITDIFSDIDNCGECGNVCSFANAIPLCNAGSCYFEDCDSHFGDCDEFSGNGCEDSLTSIYNCGACFNECEANRICTSIPFSKFYSCECSEEYTDCGECVDLKTDNNHCGSCGHFCPQNSHCEERVCVCDTGYNDCDDDLLEIPSNGCETDITAPSDCGECGRACSELMKNAATSCTVGICILVNCFNGFASCDFDLFNGCESSIDTFEHCGSCDPCKDHQHCSSGFCECDPGWKDCNSIASDGCETSLIDNNNCGDCGNECELMSATATCPNQVCQIFSCDDYYQDCNKDPSDGCETNTVTNTDCGDCGNKCNLNEDCDGRACACITPFTKCVASTLGCPTNLDTDIFNCGSCFTHCKPNMVCVKGNCVCDLENGYGNCGGDIKGGCEQLNTDENCGGCGIPCAYMNGVSDCSTGTCQGTCLPGYGNCDEDPSNGCEVQLNSLTDCGSCGTPCDFPNAVSNCVGLVCDLESCDAGFGNCNQVFTDGCETPLNTQNHCGSCGNLCTFPNAISSCNTGTCQLIGCVNGYGDCDGDQQNGCELIFAINDVNNCGGCGVNCTQSQSFFSICSNGKCIENQCSKGLGNCDLQGGNGCETILLSEGNCGECGKTCSLLPNVNLTSCDNINGLCEIFSCNEGFLNLDNNVNNGCELDEESLIPPDNYLPLPSPSSLPSPSVGGNNEGPTRPNGNNTLENPFTLPPFPSPSPTMGGVTVTPVILGSGGDLNITGVQVNYFPTSFDGTGVLTLTYTNENIVQSSVLPADSSVTSTVANVTIIGANVTGKVQICFTLTEEITDKNKACLGYIDESFDPPEWRCEDHCLEEFDSQDNSLCGDTEHFTSFAVLFGGIANGGNCNEEEDYILGSYGNDLILVGSVAAFVVLIALIIYILFSFTPLKQYAYGVEGMRVISLRSLGTEHEYNTA